MDSINFEVILQFSIAYSFTLTIAVLPWFFFGGGDLRRYNFRQFRFFPSRIWAAGLVVDEVCLRPSHWNATRTLPQWLEQQGVAGIAGIDTR